MDGGSDQYIRIVVPGTIFYQIDYMTLTYMTIGIYIYIYIFMYIHMFINVHIYIHIYVYAYA